MYPWICQPANQRHFTWIPQLSKFGSSHSQLQYITTHPEKPSSNYHPPPENKHNFLMKNKTPLFNLYKSLDVSQLWWAANTSNLPVATEFVTPALGHWVRYHHSTATFVTFHESCVQHQVCVCVCFFGCFRVVEKGGGKLGSWLDWWKEGPMVLGGCYSHWKGGEDFDPFPQICDPFAWYVISLDLRWHVPSLAQFSHV